MVIEPIRVTLGSYWTSRGSRVVVEDVVDGPNPVVVYRVSDAHLAAAKALMPEAEFVRRFEQILPDDRV